MRELTLVGAVSRPEDPETGAILGAIESTASSPGSPTSTASSGTPGGRATSELSESILEREKSWSGSRCRPERTFRGSSPIAAIGYSAEGAAQER
jgi:hypothetical protein